MRMSEMQEAALRKIYEKTCGHCHFCGDKIDFEKRGWAPDLAGRWEADHVIQLEKGGSNNPDNFLPACTRCNRLRWQRTGSSLRRLLFLGLVARDEAYQRRESKIGPQLRSTRIERLGKNWLRRMQGELRKQRGGLTVDEFRAKDAELGTRKASLMERLRAFEERALAVLRAHPGAMAWDGALEQVRNDPQTPEAWRSAEKTLGE